MLAFHSKKNKKHEDIIANERKLYVSSAIMLITLRETPTSPEIPWYTNQTWSMNGKWKLLSSFKLMIYKISQYFSVFKTWTKRCTINHSQTFFAELIQTFFNHAIWNSAMRTLDSKWNISLHITRMLINIMYPKVQQKTNWQQLGRFIIYKIIYYFLFVICGLHSKQLYTSKFTWNQLVQSGEL